MNPRSIDSLNTTHDPTALNDTEIFLRVASGDASSATWTAFVDRFSRLCYHAIHRVLARRVRAHADDAEEVFQRLFVRLLDSERALLQRYRGDNGCSPRTYLAHLAAYQALEFLREKDRRERRNTDLETPQVQRAQSRREESTPADAIDEQELAYKVRELVATLSDSDQLLYRLHYEDGHSLVQVAVLLHKSETAIHVQHHRLKERLRKRISEDNLSQFVSG